MVRMGQSPACPPKWQNEKRKEKHDNLQIWELNSFLLYKMTLSIPKTNIVVQLIPEIGTLGGKGVFCTPTWPKIQHFNIIGRETLLKQ